MATVAERMAGIRDNLLSRIESITASDQPSYTDGNRTVSKAEYLDMLLRNLETINTQIARSEPVEIRTHVHPVH